MHRQRTQRMSTPARTSRAGTSLPTSGYALIVDGQPKKEFDTRDHAVRAARDLKERSPMLQIKIYDAEKKLSENIELVAP